MLVPNASQVESAVDSLLKLKADEKLNWILPDECKELHEALGADVATRLGIVASASDVNLEIGYLLGLETARMVIAESAALIMKGVDPKDVL